MGRRGGGARSVPATRLWTVADASDAWQVNESRVRQWLRSGRIAGAVKLGPRAWIIPAGAERPADLRYREA